MVTGLVQGTYVFTLTVTDNHGLASTSTVTITVSGAANQPPVANAGSNVTLTMPTNFTILNGSGSSDPDGTIATYAWTKTSGPDSYTIASPGAVNTTINGLVEGVYVFTLKVTDNSGATSTSNVTVTVNTAAAAPPASGDQPIGYIKMSTSAINACNDVSSSGRTPVYGSSIANGAILYIDAAHSKAFNGGWNWYSITSSIGGTVAQSLAIYPNGSVNSLFSCSTGTFVPTTPVVTPPVVTPPVVTPPAQGNLLGYIKMSTSAINACNDASGSGRTAVYGRGNCQREHFILRCGFNKTI